MKVLDANFLIDHLNGVEAAKEFYEGSGGRDERWIMPVPAYAEALVGVGNLPDGDVSEAIESLDWGHVYDTDDDLAVTAAEIVDEVGPQGPYLDRIDALVVAVGRELDAPVVSCDSDLTHDEVKNVVEIEEYRS